MENEVLKDAILIVSVVAIFVFGFFIMRRLDAVLEKNCKQPLPQDDKRPLSQDDVPMSASTPKSTPESKPESTPARGAHRIVHSGDSSDEEILADVQRMRERGGTVRIVITDESGADN